MNSKLQRDFKDSACVGTAEPWYIRDVLDRPAIELTFICQVAYEKVYYH